MYYAKHISTTALHTKKMLLHNAKRRPSSRWLFHWQKQTPNALLIQHLKWSATARTSETRFQHSVVYISAVTCIQPHLLLYRAVIIWSPYLTPEANPAFEQQKVTEIPQRCSLDSQTGAWNPSLQNRHGDGTWAVGQMNRSHRRWFNEVHCNDGVI